MEIEKVDRLAGLAALTKAVDVHNQTQPLGRATTTFELVAAQRVAVPRNIPEFMSRVKILSSVAGSEYYYSFPVKKRDKKSGGFTTEYIEGPTIKLANDLAREYGNCGVETVVMDVGDSWVIYAKFIDIERGFTMVRPFQQRKGQASIGGRDDARAQDIALQIGVSKAIRNVIVNSLETYADFMFDEAKVSFVEQVKKKPDFYREKISGRLREIDVQLVRVEQNVGRKISEWQAVDIARVISQIKAVSDGMALANEVWPATAPLEVDMREPEIEDAIVDQTSAPETKAIESETLTNALIELQKMQDADQVNTLLEMAQSIMAADVYEQFELAANERKATLAGGRKKASR